MNKITVNLSKEEITKIISDYINSNLRGFEVEKISYNVYEKRDIRDQVMGLDLKGIDVEVTKES